MDGGPGRPEVTLTRSSLVAAPEQPRPAGRRPPLLLLLPVVALLVALLAGEGPARPAPVSEQPLQAELRLVPERLTVTQSGVMVLPVELRNRGDELQVRQAAAYASPVVEDPVVQAPPSIGEGDVRRFVALVAPDCRLLRTGAAAGGELVFTASLLLRVGRGSVSRDLVLDLAAEPEVRDRVVGLCDR